MSTQYLSLSSSRPLLRTWTSVLLLFLQIWTSWRLWLFSATGCPSAKVRSSRKMMNFCSEQTMFTTFDAVYVVLKLMNSNYNWGWILSLATEFQGQSSNNARVQWSTKNCTIKTRLFWENKSLIAWTPTWNTTNLSSKAWKKHKPLSRRLPDCDHLLSVFILLILSCDKGWNKGRKEEKGVDFCNSRWLFDSADKLLFRMGCSSPQNATIPNIPQAHLNRVPPPLASCSRCQILTINSTSTRNTSTFPVLGPTLK